MFVRSSLTAHCVDFDVGCVPVVNMSACDILAIQPVESSANYGAGDVKLDVPNTSVQTSLCFNCIQLSSLR